jgi:hypothetical protein
VSCALSERRAPEEGMSVRHCYCIEKYRKVKSRKDEELEGLRGNYEEIRNSGSPSGDVRHSRK